MKPRFSDRDISGRKEFFKMLPDFKRQATKHMNMIKETVRRILKSVPDSVNVDEIMRGLRLAEIPTLVALPHISKDILSDIDGADNVLFEEDFTTQEDFCTTLKKKGIIDRVLSWSQDIQDYIIAGLFALTYDDLLVMPLQTAEATFALYKLTEKQSKAVANQNRPINYVVGPAGTGKTWMLIFSMKKTYDAMKNKIERGKLKDKGKILVLTYNKPMNEFIKDTRNQFISQSGDNSFPKCDVFTVDGLMEYMKNRMRGKMIARASHQSNARTISLANNNFTDIFRKYRSLVGQKTFVKEFGYDAIFIDEAQDIPSSHCEWLDAIWTKDRLVKDELDSVKKKWIFGDNRQNLYGFRDVEENLLTAPGVDPNMFETLDRQLRSTEQIFNRYHDIRFGPSRTLQEGSFDNVHCNSCNLKTSKIGGTDITEELANGGINAICDKLVLAVKDLVKDGVSFMDTAILCVDRYKSDIETIKRTLKNALTSGTGAMIKQRGNLDMIDAENFATKCKKVRRRGRKRKADGTVQQKKFLCVDTVRRFKGLEAEVKPCAIQILTS